MSCVKTKYVQILTFILPPLFLLIAFFFMATDAICYIFSNHTYVKCKSRNKE